MHLINIRFSKTVSVKRHLSGRNIFPAMLNSRSTGPEDAGTDKYHICLLIVLYSKWLTSVLSLVYYFWSITITNTITLHSQSSITITITYYPMSYNCLYFIFQDHISTINKDCYPTPRLNNSVLLVEMDKCSVYNKAMVATMNGAKLMIVFTQQHSLVRGDYRIHTQDKLMIKIVLLA